MGLVKYSIMSNHTSLKQDDIMISALVSAGASPSGSARVRVRLSSLGWPEKVLVTLSSSPALTACSPK